MASLKVDATRCLLVLFIVFILSLSGFYLGGIFLVLFWILFSFLLFDLILLANTARATMYIQNFSTEHPVKGEDIQYTLKIYFESFLPGLRCFVTFKGVRKDEVIHSGMDDFGFFPLPQEIVARNYTVQCPFRGIYTVGLDRLEIEDVLSIISIRLKVWYRTFYVFPRLIKLSSMRLPTTEGDMAESITAWEGGTYDNTRFTGITEYRPGEPVRSMAWKRFGASGIAFVRTYETSSSPGVTFYIDLCRKGPPDYLVFDAEDCSIEVLLASVYFFLRSGVAVHVRIEDSLTSFDAADVADTASGEFIRFLESTVNWSFSEGARPSALEVLEADKRGGAIPTASVVGIFRSFDEEVLSFIEDQGDRLNATAFVIASSLSEESAQALARYRSSGVKADHLIVIRNSGTIQEDLS